MAFDKVVGQKLTRFANAFREARERGANESDTVMYLVKFFEEVLGYDALRGEISKELQIKDRFCDIALKIEGAVRVLVEVKAAGVKALVDKHIEQAESYAAHSGLPWVLLTNGVEWRLYHLTFNQGEGIAHDVAFEVKLVDDIEAKPEAIWAKLEMLSRAGVKKGALEEFWSQKKVLSPTSVVRVLFGEDVLRLVRRELRKDSEVMLDIQDVFGAVRDVISKEALAEAGELGITKRRKRRRKPQRAEAPQTTAAATGADGTDGAAALAGEPLAVVTAPPFPTSKPPGGAQA
jgi:hypothetical protein